MTNAVPGATRTYELAKLKKGDDLITSLSAGESIEYVVLSDLNGVETQIDRGPLTHQGGGTWATDQAVPTTPGKYDVVFVVRVAGDYDEFVGGSYLVIPSKIPV